MTRLEKISEYLSFLVEEAAKADDKTKLFNDVTLIYGYCELQLEIDHVLQELTSRKKLVSDVLGIPEFEYLTVNNIEYLIEVPLEKDNLVPISWRKMNMTKTTSRYRTPEIDDLVQKLSQLEEQKYNICLAYWKQFLEDFNSNFFAFKEVVDSLAKLDCYFSLAEFSTKDGYCKPNILHSTEICIDIVGGRHPLIEKYLPNDVEYIPNDLHLDSEKKGVIVTGPNMGGKSCFIKQVGIIALLAQIGSFVPAKNVSITPLDAIYVRMGSVDNIEENQSSFFVEAMETNNILSDVSRESLVLFDEFGCGTSTHDGMAIAYATLHHLLYKVKCFTLFVTHFMAITDLGLPSNSLAKNTHMTFMLNQADNEDVDQKVLFLYKLSNGTSKESYGMNVAKLVSIPEIIIKNAHAKSEIFKEAIEDRRKTRQLFKSIMQSNFPPNLRQLINFSK